MIKRSAVCCAVLLAVATCAWSADGKAPKKHARHSSKPAAKAAKAAPKRPPHRSVDKTTAKSATAAVTARAVRVSHGSVVRTSLRPPAPAATVLHGPREVLTCREGTEDRHARIAVVLVGGRTESFAYYSKWKPRTCSIYFQRNRDSSRWTDHGSVTDVSAQRAQFTIDHGKGEYRIAFRDVDRERYCGMDGAINGTLTIRKGSERCEIAGIMDEGVPLGQAVAYANAAAAASPAPAPAAPSPTAPTPVAASTHSESSFFKRLVQSVHHQPSATWNPGVMVGD